MKSVYFLNFTCIYVCLSTTCALCEGRNTQISKQWGRYTGTGIAGGS